MYKLNWQLVPVTATPEMCKSIADSIKAGWQDSIVWTNVLDTAPPNKDFEEMLESYYQRGFNAGRALGQQGVIEWAHQNNLNDVITDVQKQALIQGDVPDTLRAVKYSVPVIKGADKPEPQEQPVATLHDDGHWVWKGTEPYEARYAGWRMEVYATIRPPKVERALLNLLAVIHGDGGHYTEEHGIEKAAADAEVEVVKLRRQVQDSTRDY